MNAILSLATAFGLSTSAGLNAYIPLLIVALLARYTDLVQLSPEWAALANGWVIALMAVLLAVEVVADKVPAVDSLNDILQTVVRPAAGAILFAATTGHAVHLHPVLAMALGVILAGSVHAVKAGGRPLVTAATGGTANALVSTMEDAIATTVSLVAVLFPYLMLLWLLFLLWLLVWWRKRRARRRG